LATTSSNTKILATSLPMYIYFMMCCRFHGTIMLCYAQCMLNTKNYGQMIQQKWSRLGSFHLVSFSPPLLGALFYWRFASFSFQNDLERDKNFIKYDQNMFDMCTSRWYKNNQPCLQWPKWLGSCSLVHRGGYLV
jgi:hypothetical protein